LFAVIHFNYIPTSTTLADSHCHAAGGLGDLGFSAAQNSRDRFGINLPSLEDCFSFAAITIVMRALVLIGVRVPATQRWLENMHSRGL